MAAAREALKPLTYGTALNMSIDQLITYIDCKNPAMLTVQQNGQKYPSLQDGRQTYMDGGAKPGKIDYIVAAILSSTHPREGVNIIKEPERREEPPVPAEQPPPAAAPATEQRREPPPPAAAAEQAAQGPPAPEPPKEAAPPRQEQPAAAATVQRPPEQGPAFAPRGPMQPARVKMDEPLAEAHGGAFKPDQREFAGESEEFTGPQIDLNKLPRVEDVHPELFQ